MWARFSQDSSEMRHRRRKSENPVRLKASKSAPTHYVCEFPENERDVGC